MFDFFRKKRPAPEAGTPESGEAASPPNPSASPAEPTPDETIRPADAEKAPEPTAEPADDERAVAPSSSEASEPVEFAPPDEAEADLETADEPKTGWFGRLRRKLASTRDMLAGRLETVLSSVREIDEDVLDELEEILITADLGVKTSQDVLFKIRGQVAKKELKDSAALKKAIKARVSDMVRLPTKPPIEAKPFAVLVVGVNGVGKTTTIAKLAHRYESEGKKVLLAAGDTFRAAAVEQMTIWAKRIGVDIVSQPTGSDASAVVFDALTAAKARNADVVLIDTAGRLHTKVNLMDELRKIKRVAGKALPGAPHETILVIDANTGQNAARQAEMFNEALGVDSIIVTKLDGASKGGVIVSIIHEQKLPVSFVGLGESFADLRPFDPEAFVEATLGSDDE